MKQVARALVEQRQALVLPVVTSFWASGDLGETTAPWPKSCIRVALKQYDSRAVVPFEAYETITMALPRDPAKEAERVDLEALIDSLVRQLSGKLYFSDHARIHRQSFVGVKYSTEIGTTIIAELAWVGAASYEVVD